jgi:hypothetical protein
MGPMSRLKDIKSKGICMMSKIKWIEKGNSCTKEFFLIVKEKKTRVMVTSLRKVDGEMASSQEEIKETCKAF